MYERFNDVNLGGDVTSTAGSANIPYLDYVKSGYNVYNKGVEGLMSPATIGLAAKSAMSYAPSGLAAGAGSTVSGMYAALGAAILTSQILSAKKKQKWLEEENDNPFIDKGKNWSTQNQGGEPSWSPVAWGLMNPHAGQPGYGEYDFSKVPTGAQMAKRFKQEFGVGAPTADKMKNWERGPYVDWIARQPEIAAAQKDYNDWLAENYVWHQDLGDGVTNGTWVKKKPKNTPYVNHKNLSGMMGGY